MLDNLFRIAERVFTNQVLTFLMCFLIQWFLFFHDNLLRVISLIKSKNCTMDNLCQFCHLLCTKIWVTKPIELLTIYFRMSFQPEEYPLHSERIDKAFIFQFGKSTLKQKRPAHILASLLCSSVPINLQFHWLETMGTFYFDVHWNSFFISLEWN